MTPAEMLERAILDGGWKVVKVAARKPNATGGHFSKGYIVEHLDGREGFLKAMDYTAAFAPFVDTAFMLNVLTETYLFEKNLCLRCRDQSLRRVVHAIDSGTIQLNPANPLSKVEYLLFEKADGDIRAHLDAQADFDVAFALRALHNVAVGLEQLHRVNVAHQDLKPSNVLLFGGQNGSKIADLGRAWVKDMPAPHDGVPFAGERTYAPPELLYGQISPKEQTRRFGCDMYHLGSLAVFLFTRVHMNSLLTKYLVPEHQYHNWGGDYAGALPYVHAAFAQAIDEFKADLPDPIKNELALVVAQLCEPDPAKRGHLLNRHGGGNQYSLERYISILDRLAFTAEVCLKGKVA